MKHVRGSIGISKFDQGMYYQYDLSARKVWLYNPSGKVINFGLPKSGGYVPKSNLLRRSKNLGLVDEIYNIAELQFCVWSAR